MIQQETRLQIVDNSGIKTVKCIGIIGGSGKAHASTGNIIKASVQELRSNRSKRVGYKKGDLVFCLIVLTSSSLNRKNGQQFKFLKNSAILTDINKKPLASRITSPLLRELRSKKFLKILSLTSTIL